jgi:hypothetical protein
MADFEKIELQELGGHIIITNFDKLYMAVYSVWRIWKAQ